MVKPKRLVTKRVWVTLSSSGAFMAAFEKKRDAAYNHFPAMGQRIVRATLTYEVPE